MGGRFFCAFKSTLRMFCKYQWVYRICVLPWVKEFIATPLDYSTVIDYLPLLM